MTSASPAREGRLRIAFARRGYSGTGGAEAYLKRFAAALCEAGHEAILYASEAWPPHAWPGTEVKLLPGSTPRRYADALRGVPECDCLFSMERVWRCDVYRAGDGVHRVWMERRRGAEPFWKAWGRIFNGKHRELLALEERLFSPEGAGVVIANSRMVKEEIIRHYGYPAERIPVIYNGVPARVPLCDGERARRRKELGLAESTTVFLFAGSGWERKGLAHAIRALGEARLRDAVLLVAGRGNPRRMPASPQVRYLGPVEGMAAFYGLADAFILPTLYDPFSNASLEAMAAGLPVITSRFNGFAEIIEPGVEGEVVDDPADIPALARALRAWGERERCGAVRPRLQERARPLSIRENLRQTLAVITAGRAVPS